MMFSIFYTTVLQAIAYDRQTFEIKVENQSTDQTKDICFSLKTKSTTENVLGYLKS